MRSNVILLAVVAVLAEGVVSRNEMRQDKLNDIAAIIRKFHGFGLGVAQNTFPEPESGNEIHKASPSANGFSWSSCSAAGDPSNLTSLSLTPDPLKIPGNITVSFSGELGVDLSTPIKLELMLKKKVFFWVEIPCIDNVGSCTYDDVCALLKSFKCPPVFVKHGIPCRCPVKAGKYSLPSSDIFIDPAGIPSFLEDGDYRAQAKLLKGDQEITCVNIQISIS
ncbi:hypothetical protein CAPTEDRAFT_155689 [Capitella teleta]|uniref:MD-2-related lipid-recognition domain-containing protein n=1 Tax=Capitella teleta TaxID=283909 RepID=R7UJ32_CAPTE|nr:hypothetical protein CAPTEDRAFT_155689 [Capitella teleta]|eukprot:ELU03813.1 hypothetical protein CAPTEDRAFT_155689 [Capitella teleta]